VEVLEKLRGSYFPDLECKMTWMVVRMGELQTLPSPSVVVEEERVWVSPPLVLPAQIQKMTARTRSRCCPLRLKLKLERETKESESDPG
jgi:hypothetical protein